MEYQHRGSPHVHGVAWLEDAPDITFIDKTVTTINPAVLPDGSYVSDAPVSKTNPNVCNKAYSEVVRTCVPPVRDTPIVLLPTVSAPNMASTSVDPSHHSQSQG